MHRHVRAALVALAAVSFAAAPLAAQELKTQKATLRIVTVAQGLEHPWGLQFLPDGRLLVTERPGRLRTVTREGAVSPPIAGVPPVWVANQGGLLDVVLAPDFATSRVLYLSFSEQSGGGGRTAVARAELEGGGLVNVRVIFRQNHDAPGGRHFGSRLVFGRDGMLFVTTGDRGNQMDRAQELGSHIGKVLRLRPDGSPAPDNPFAGRAGALPEIWSYGHRNIQGAALHPQTGELWTHEHGALGGDEVNLTRAGRNYGWPVITHGRDYSGAKIGEGSAKPGMEQPLIHWSPSIAPSGMAFYTGGRIAGWKGSLLLGALRSQLLVRLELDGERVIAQEQIALGERIRDVRMGPDEAVYLLTDGLNGRLLRLEPR